MMRKTTYKEHQFFIFNTHTLQSKNKLQLDVLRTIVDRYNRRFVIGNNIAKLYAEFKKEVETLEAKHPRCKRLNIHYDMPDMHSIDGSIYEPELFTIKLYQVKRLEDHANEATLTNEIRKHTL